MVPNTPTHPDDARPATAAVTSLLTDQYELTMLDTAVRSGTADVPAVFEVFGRSLPAGRRYGVVAGVARLLDHLAAFRFGDAELAWLESVGLLAPQTLEVLARYRFRGRIEAYLDGELYFPQSPIVTVTGTYTDVVLETIVLSALNQACAVASAASRMRVAAGEAQLIEMGSRRTHPLAAVDAALAAYVGGFDATSNLEAGRRYGIPTVGTASHSSVLAAPSERAAFDAQIAAHGVGTTLLVDTFHIPTGVATAIDAARAVGARGPGAVRIDSGDPQEIVPIVRAQLDAAGAVDTQIVLTGDVDEAALVRHRDLPIDAYGVGTAVVTGSGHPAAGLVYKLVSVADRPDGTWRDVAKRSAAKISYAGRKHAWRELDASGRAVREQVVPEAAASTTRVEPSWRPLQTVVWDDGPTGAAGTPTEARARHRAALAELAPEQLVTEPGGPAIPTRVAPLAGGVPA